MTSESKNPLNERAQGQPRLLSSQLVEEEKKDQSISDPQSFFFDESSFKETERYPELDKIIIKKNQDKADDKILSGYKSIERVCI